MEYEQLRKLRGGDGVVRGDEDGLLCQAIDDDEDGGETIRFGKLLDEVHGDGVPWSVCDGELLEHAVQAMPLGLRTCTGGAGPTVFTNELMDLGPRILAANDLEGLVLPKVAHSGVVMGYESF